MSVFYCITQLYFHVFDLPSRVGKLISWWFSRNGHTVRYLAQQNHFDTSQTNSAESALSLPQQTAVIITDGVDTEAAEVTAV